MSEQRTRPERSAVSPRDSGVLFTLMTSIVAAFLLAGPAQAGDYRNWAKSDGHVGVSVQRQSGPFARSAQVVTRYAAPAYISEQAAPTVQLTAPYERYVDGGSVVGIPAPGAYRQNGTTVIAKTPITRGIYRGHAIGPPLGTIFGGGYVW